MLHTRDLWTKEVLHLKFKPKVLEMPALFEINEEIYTGKFTYYDRSPLPGGRLAVYSFMASTFPKPQPVYVLLIGI